MYLLFFCFPIVLFVHYTGIHYVGKMIEGDSTKVLLDQITEGQVIWVPMDKEYDIVSSLLIAVTGLIFFQQKIAGITLNCNE